MRFAEKHLVIDNLLDGAAGSLVNSDALFLNTMQGFSVQAVITTTDAIGTFKLQTSNDNENWVDYPSSSDALSGADKNIMWNVSDVEFSYARVVYTRVSGGGVGTLCNIKATLKGSK